MKKVLSVIMAFVLATVTLISPMEAGAATLSSKAGIVNTATDRLIVRSAPKTSSSTLTSLAKDSHITLISKSGDWWYVEYEKNKFGYCFGSYIKETASTPKSVNISSGTLNVRSGAGTTNKIVGSLTKNQVVLVLSVTGSWSKVLYNGRYVGYVSSTYLSGSSTSTENTVKLNVPSFKQTDSRWANVKIGSSGKTIAQIGCATTAIAMIESYRKGTTITPDAMSKQLKYTASGSVYWPSHYKVNTSSAGYITNIRSILNQKKPVLFGAKNRYGGQHWVVITGYTSGGTKTSDFLINDPGTNTRKTLAQFLAEYSTFYKYFSY